MQKSDRRANRRTDHGTVTFAATSGIAVSDKLRICPIARAYSGTDYRITRGRYLTEIEGYFNGSLIGNLPYIASPIVT